ncbi:AraC family transcriptional regulator [Vallitalea okinawensis]|uniref:AraC family transcriptional regulator n=1 Tax=Vallitalea okinawensis TaxID=2078660 RepID=UPI000CFBEAC8|nr:AraC family transcriptional regulator [Vallitalea okinawensis]
MDKKRNQSRFIRLPIDIINTKQEESPVLKGLITHSVGYREGRSAHHRNIKKHGLEEYFINYCIKGEGWVDVNNRRITISSGDIFLCPTSVDHSYSTGLKNPWETYWSYFSGDYSEYLYQLIDSDLKPIVFNIGYHMDIVSSFEEILLTLDKGYAANKHILHATSCLQRILTMIMQLQLNSSKDRKNAHQDVISNSIRYMQDNIDAFIELDILAANSHLSKDYFGKLFKKEVGYAPLDYFLRLKMQKACELLDITDLSIKEISLSLGYKDYYYFSRCFKKKIGMSPEYYRDSMHRM